MQTGAESSHKFKFAIAIAIALIFIVLVIYLLSNFLTNYSASNKMAFDALRSQISLYGTNVRYLLSTPPPGYTLPSSLYNPIYNLSYPGTVNSILSSLFINKTAFQQLISPTQNWAARDPSVKRLVFNALFSLGVFTPSSPQPANTTNLESVYLMTLIGENIMLIASSEENLTSSGFFTAENVSAPRYVGIGSYPIGTSSGNGFETSTTYAPALSMAPIAGVMPEWAVISSDLNATFELAAQAGRFKYNGTATSLQSLLYLMSLAQYQSYQFYEMLFNKSIPAEIDFIGYAHNTLIVNLGNLDLNGNYSVSVKLDNQTVKSTRYLNWIVSNASISPGLHNISVSFNGSQLYANLYVSPYLLSYSTLHSTLEISGVYTKLTIWLENPRNLSTLNISNVNVSITPPYFDLPATQVTPSSEPTPYPSSPTQITLHANQNVTLNYTVTWQGNSVHECGQGTPYAYYMSFDTNLGKSYYVLPGACT